PSATLFPYTTLFRSQIGCLAGRGPSLPARGGRTRPSLLGGWGNGPAPAGGALFPRGRGFGGGGRRRTALLLGQGRRRRGGRRGRDRKSTRLNSSHVK